MLSLTHSFNTGGSLCIGLAGTRQATRRTAMMLHEAAINNSDTIIIFFMSESMRPLDCFSVNHDPAAMARQPARTHVPPVPDPSTRLLTSVSFATPVLYHFTWRICRDVSVSLVLCHRGQTLLTHFGLIMQDSPLR